MTYKNRFLFLVCTGIIFFQACTSSNEDDLNIDDDIAVSEANDEPAETANSNIQETTIKPQRGKKSKYPFPQAINVFTLDKFFQIYEGVFQKYQPLQKEYDLYSSTLNETEDIQESAAQTVKSRVRELPEKAHWVYFYAINDLLHFLQNNSRKMLRVDLEDNFTARMRVIAQLSQEISDVLLDKRYSELSKNLYITLNQRYFDRVVKPRSN